MVERDRGKVKERGIDMGLFDRIFPKRVAQTQAGQTFSTLTAYQPTFRSWNGRLYESELCRIAIDTVARHTSKLKVELMGSAQPNLKTLVKHKPNEWMTWSQFLYRVMTILLCTNNCAILPILDSDLNTTGFFPVLPEDAELKEYGGKVWVRYKFRTGKVGAIEYDRCAILTRFQYEDDFWGSTNHALDDTLKLAHLQKQSVSLAVKENSTYRFMAQADNFIKPEDLAKERQRFTKKNFSAEAEANNGLLLFPNTYKNVQQINSKPYTVDADEQKLIQTSVEQYFGVNEKVINNSATGDELDAFFNGIIEPFAIQLSEAMSKAIYTDLERSYGSYVRVDANRLQYMSTTAKVQMAKELGDRGMLTINEMRELFNYPPIPNGDTAVIRGEYYSVDDKLGEENNGEENNS